VRSRNLLQYLDLHLKRLRSITISTKRGSRRNSSDSNNNFGFLDLHLDLKDLRSYEKIQKRSLINSIYRIYNFDLKINQNLIFGPYFKFTFVPSISTIAKIASKRNNNSTNSKNKTNSKNHKIDSLNQTNSNNN
jgi:hypothetical protein